MAITINHQTNAITATAGSVSINGSVPSASGLTLLETATSTGTTQLELLSFSDTYNNYMILFNCYGSVNFTYLQCQFKYSSGYATGSYGAVVMATNSNIANVQVITSTNGILTPNILTADAPLQTTGQSFILNARNSNLRKMLSTTYAGINADAYTCVGTSTVSYSSVLTAITGIKFFSSSGNIAGTVRLYGIAS